MLACGDIMPTGWTPAAASSTLEEWTRTFSRGQQCSAGINSNVDVCEKAKHHTELFW